MTGDHLWSIETSQYNSIDETMNTAVVLDTLNDMAYAVWITNCYGFDLISRDTVWQIQGSFGYHGGTQPSFVDGQLFTINYGRLAVFDGSTGGLLWGFEPEQFHGVPADEYPEKAIIYTPVIANGYVFLSSINHVWAVDIYTHELVWEAPFGGVPSVAGRSLYLANDTGII
jgi:outer membrane protein assembly factor BamB